ncbi:hypothetical protein D7Z54_07185 [Salibacterium salarium]|uniref:Uncharacterized protein n=1 Tax=Salibacterium salarium TaxID=284579 RepID=A0A428N6F2_9BACI|nr:hypothetical protein [Salibacterium salarium]RSL33898.1 hypothetical protein D7Z54_07185 [Salibacterium salarium]
MNIQLGDENQLYISFGHKYVDDTISDDVESSLLYDKEYRWNGIIIYKDSAFPKIPTGQPVTETDTLIKIVFNQSADAPLYETSIQEQECLLDVKQGCLTGIEILKWFGPVLDTQTFTLPYLD